MKKIGIEKTVLENGLRVITAYKDTDIFSMGAGVGVGSLYENEINNGISHMIEHMLFKGTINRDADMLNDDLEKLAGDFDIYTTYNETVLTIDTMKKHGEKSLEIVSDMFMNAAFPEKEFRLEKKVIIEEIKMSNDDPEDWSYLGLYRAAFPERWYKYHITGTMKSVRSLKTGMLREFYDSYYIPGNTVICIVSSFTHKEILELVNKYFGDWQKKQPVTLKKEEYAVKPQRVKRYKKGIGQTHLLYGFSIEGLTEREEIILTLVNEKIGAGSNSILFKELRDKKGYAYSVYSDVDFIENLKMFYIYAGISEENLKETITIIDDIIEKFRSRAFSLTEDMVSLLKEIFITNSAIRTEVSSHLVDYMLDGELNYGNPAEFQKFLSVIQDISPEEIHGVVEKVLKEPIVHVLLPK